MRASRPQAFVIMPFGPEFDAVWRAVERGLRVGGLQPRRGDTHLDQVNILRDVLEGIHEAALVVADLTGGNPNVFYELGVAHTRGKRVLMIMRDGDRLPFNLQSYRTVMYTTGEEGLSELARHVETVAVGTTSSDMRFANPVSDFATGLFVVGSDGNLSKNRAATSTTLDWIRSNHAEVLAVVRDERSSLERARSRWGQHGGRAMAGAQSSQAALKERIAELGILATRLASTAADARAHWSKLGSLADKLASDDASIGDGRLIAAFRDLLDQSVRPGLTALRTASDADRTFASSAPLIEANTRWSRALDELVATYAAGASQLNGFIAELRI